MANFNKVILIGNLTRDPEARTFGNGGKVVKFGLAVNNRRKNSQTGQMDDDPMFIDCSAFNRDNYKLADIIEQYCRKGSQICIEGKLKLDRWDDKTTGQKRSKHEITVDSMQLLGTRQDSLGGGGDDGDGYNRGASSPRPAASASARSNAPPSGNDGYGDEMEPPRSGSSGEPEDVPF